jgi:hypothetical protein
MQVGFLGHSLYIKFYSSFSALKKYVPRKTNRVRHMRKLLCCSFKRLPSLLCRKSNPMFQSHDDRLRSWSRRVSLLFDSEADVGIARFVGTCNLWYPSLLFIYLFLALTITSVAATAVYPHHLYLCRLWIHCLRLSTTR